MISPFHLWSKRIIGYRIRDDSCRIWEWYYPSVKRGAKESNGWTSLRPRLLAAISVPAKSALFVLGFTILLAYFYPVVLTLSWHLRNGSFVVYKGRNIPVPLRWTAKVEPEDVLLMKLGWTVFAKPPFHNWIFFDPSPFQSSGSRDEAVKSWEAHYWTAEARTDDIVSGPFTIRSATNDAQCMKSVSKGNPESTSADCLIFQPILSANFGGERKDFDTFLQILSEMK